MTGYKSKKAAAQDKLAPNNETLVKRLRHTASRGVSVWGDLMLEAAEALEQPLRRPWVGLTEEELKPICDEWRIVYGAWMKDFARDIEIKLKEKNT